MKRLEVKNTPSSFGLLLLELISMPLWSRLALAGLQGCRVLLVALALWYFSLGTMLLGFLPQLALALLLKGLIVLLLFHAVCELQTWVSQSVARR